jgi:alkylhydroperoxidase/carboxymuconolactone decarboxylase family protein YurZ
MAKKQGVTKEELFELLLFLTIYVGFNKAGAYYNEVAKNYGS